MAAYLDSRHRPRRPLILSNHDRQFWSSSGNSGEHPECTDCATADPSITQLSLPLQAIGAGYPDIPDTQSPQTMAYPLMCSPARSKPSVRSPHSSNAKIQTSPHPHANICHPYPGSLKSRRPSISSTKPRHSQGPSPDEFSKVLCPYPTCGRHFKDLGAHMLTHQNERPEKCPILTCEYHTKGFARKYDKNRHTLVHYKGAMMCGFCPGSDSSVQKSFNRADVFKRHLISVHVVKQQPPRSRSKSLVRSKQPAYSNFLDISGICSTCGIMFASAQKFYEHLDDCVLKFFHQVEPAKRINKRLLLSITDVPAVNASVESHNFYNTFK
jgi:hypothetical protein